MSYDGTDVLAAFVAWWNGTPAATALTTTGVIWHKEAPEGALLPYATFFLVSDTAETQTTGYAQKRAAIQVNLHHNTDAAARAMWIAFRQAVRKAPLTIGGSAVMHCLPDGDGIDIGEGLGPQGQDCWLAFQVLDIPYTEI